MKQIGRERLQAVECAPFWWTDAWRSGWFLFRGVIKCCRVRRKELNTEAFDFVWEPVSVINASQTAHSILLHTGCCAEENPLQNRQIRVSVHLHAVSAARGDWSKLCCAGSTIAESVCMPWGSSLQQHGATGLGVVVGLRGSRLVCISYKQKRIHSL